MSIGPFIQKGDVLYKIPEGNVKGDYELINMKSINDEFAFDTQENENEDYKPIEDDNLDDSVVNNIRITPSNTTKPRMSMSDAKSLNITRTVKPLTNPMKMFLLFNKDLETNFE